MRKTILLITMTLFLVACQQQAADSIDNMEDDQEAIKIGFIGALTGDVANIGVPVQMAVELAEQEINNEGGVTGVPIEVVYEDDKCVGREGVTVTTKLIDIDKVSAIVGPLCSAVGVPTYAVAEPAGVLMMGYGTSSPTLTPDTPYYFRTHPSDALASKVGAALTQQRGYEKVAIFYVNDEYGVAYKDAYQELLEDMEIEIVSIQSYDAGQVDFKTQIQKMIQAEPDMIYSIIFPKEGGLYVKQARELGVEAQIITSETIYKDKDFMDATGDASEGLIGTTAKTPANEVNADFITNYQQMHGEEPGAFSAFGYDALKLVAKAMRECGMTHDEMKQCLDSMEPYEGASGTIIFDEYGDPQKEYEVFEIQNGEFVTIDNVDPASI